MAMRVADRLFHVSTVTLTARTCWELRPWSEGCWPLSACSCLCGHASCRCDLLGLTECAGSTGLTNDFGSRLAQPIKACKSLSYRAASATAYAAWHKIAPGDRTADTHNGVRADTIDKTAVSPSATPVGSAASASAEPAPEPTSCSWSKTCTSASSTPPTGELLRDLTLDPARNYQPTGRPPGPRPEHHARPATKKPRILTWVRVIPMS